MSEDIYRSEIERLKSENKKHRAIKVKRGKELDSLRSEFEAVVKERDELKARQNVEPSDLQAEVDSLRGELRQREHKDVWRDVAANLKIRPEARDDVWKLSGWEVAGEANPEAMSAHFRAYVQGKPHFLQDAGVEEAKPQEKPMTAGPGLDRGLAPTVGFVVKSSELRTIGLDPIRASKMVEAQRNGTLTIVPG